MKHELAVREGDRFLFRKMGTSHIFRCRDLRSDGGIEFIHDRSGVILRLCRGAFASLVREGRAILVCPASGEAERHSRGPEATKWDPRRPSNALRLGQMYRFSLAGSAGLYVFKGFLPGNRLFFTEARNRNALALTAGQFETLRCSGEAVPVMADQEAVLRFLRSFELWMAATKGFDTFTQPARYRRH